MFCEKKKGIEKTTYEMLVKRNRKSFLSKRLETMDSCHLSCLTFPTGSAVICVSIGKTVILMWNSSANNQSKIHASFHNIPAQYFSGMKNWRKGFFFKLTFSLEAGRWGYFFRTALEDVVAHRLVAPEGQALSAKHHPTFQLSHLSNFFKCQIPFLTRFTGVLKNLTENQIGKMSNDPSSIWYRRELTA